MRIKALIDEDFVNYKKPVMFIGTCFCDWKCCKENGLPESVCQNNKLANSPIIDVNDDDLIKRYLNNDITEAMCFGGLEPFKQFDELIAFIDKFRNYYHCDDTVIIYTGYYPEEIEPQLSILKQFSNIVLKCGRYIPNRPSKYDDILGITLASDNQYAKLVNFDQIKSS